MTVQEITNDSQLHSSKKMWIKDLSDWGGRSVVCGSLRVGGEVTVTCNESQGWRKTGFNFQNARCLTLYAALLFPSLSTLLTLLKDKFSIVNKAKLGP